MHDGRFARTELMIGAEALERLGHARVTVVGLGAVGSYAVEGLARSGVGHLRLIDFDVVCLSNINRQLFALDSTVGLPKHEVAVRRVRDINPACVVEGIGLRVTDQTAAEAIAGAPDLVVDAIDSPSGKLALLAACLRAGTPVVSSMGAALRRDPGRVRTGLLSETRDCPLARGLRHGLRKLGLPLDVPCVFSDEPADPALTREPEDFAEPDAPPNAGRKRRILASFPTVTGTYGLRLADLALRVLLGE
jgi:tRNA threonylcarbamoyladenosine dehydratase